MFQTEPSPHDIQSVSIGPLQSLQEGSQGRHPLPPARNCPVGHVVGICVTEVWVEVVVVDGVVFVGVLVAEATQELLSGLRTLP